MDLNMTTTEWIQMAKDNNFTYLLIVKDLEDRDLFPVFFRSEKDMDEYRNSIISESKMIIVEIINI